jgi:hypothetical protein
MIETHETPPMSNKIFISHRSGDEDWVSKAVDKWLRMSDFAGAKIEDESTWGAGAEDARTAIQKRISAADTVLVVWSEAAATSSWVYYEIGIAQALGKRIVVLLAGGSPSALPEGLADAQHVTLPR